MKILVISLHEQRIGGGEGRLAYEFAVEMSRRHAVALVYPGLAPDKLPDDAHLIVYPIRSLDATIPALTGGEMRALFRFLGEFKPDVIHSHTPFLLGSIIQAWAFIHGIPFFFTAHELPSKITGWGLIRYMRPLAQNGLTRLLTRAYLVSFCRGCTAVVALNKAAMDDLRLIRYRGRLFVIPNGRTLSLYDGKPTVTTEGSVKNLAFVGDIIPRKNQKYLVDVMSHLPPCYHLFIIGHAVDHRYRRQMESQMPRDVWRRVTFTGRLDHSRVPEYLARTRLWVSASLMEVQSLAVMEALASGTPVLGLANETIDEMVDERVGMRLERDATPEAFARAVRALCETDGARYQAMCEKARESVRRFDWANVAGMTERMYRSASRGVGRTRRGTVSMPLLLSVAQMLLILLMYGILRIRTITRGMPRWSRLLMVKNERQTRWMRRSWLRRMKRTAREQDVEEAPRS
jgi:glycosyltransferase involved in cell wall biosynthesis